VQRTFHKLDEDGSGSISAEELVRPHLCTSRSSIPHQFMPCHISYQQPLACFIYLSPAGHVYILVMMGRHPLTLHCRRRPSEGCGCRSATRTAHI
jgi:hypothetical protein